MILSSVEGDEGLYQSKLLAVGPKQFNNQICLTFGQIQTFIPLYLQRAPWLATNLVDVC